MKDRADWELATIAASALRNRHHGAFMGYDVAAMQRWCFDALVQAGMTPTEVAAAMTETIRDYAVRDHGLTPRADGTPGP